MKKKSKENSNNMKEKNVKENNEIEVKVINKKAKPKKPKSKFWKRIRLVLLIILIVILILVGIFIYKTNKNGGGLQGMLATAMGHDEFTLKDLDPITFLVLGISGCEEDYKLADTIMVCSYNPKAQQGAVLSIPRDTYVGKNKEKASASYKINAVYRNGENVEGMVKELEKVTGLEIPNYLIIDTEALVELVDAIGGVEFDVPIDMQYDDVTQDLHIDLKAGYQKLNGQQAEWLVRFRHNNDGTSYSFEYGDNDIGRMKTQRQFIMQTLKQTMRSENIFKISKIAKIGFNNIKTNMEFDTVKDYLPYAVNFDAENLKTGTLPGASEQANGIWIYTVNKKQTEQVVEELFKIKEEVDSEENIETSTKKPTSSKSNTITAIDTKQEAQNKSKEELQIEVLNGSGKKDTLEKVINSLKEKGYNVVKSGNNKTVLKTSIINKTNQSTETTNDIRAILGVGVAAQKSDNSKVDYTIVIGKDYNK